MNIAFIPIDNRPVCYTLPQQICAIDSEIDLFIPERKFLGSLTKYADVEAIFEWLEHLPKIDAIVMCLDTVAYGGLISSRRCPDTFDEIKTRVEKLKAILEKKNAKIYAFSSIMRISNNNVNEEEKEYWNKWGKKIFEYSFNSCKSGKMVQTDVPQEILDDYLATRKRNFEINKLFLEYQKQGLFETLVFSKDDCAEFGFNVKEAKELESLGGFVKTGADEIPLTLLARAVSKAASKAAKQLGSEAAKHDLDAKRRRCEDAKSVTEADAIDRHCEITDECLTRGASNEIHICDSNMNDSYEREVISRPKALSSRKNPADTNSTQLQEPQNNFPDTDYASTPLGILASYRQVCQALPDNNISEVNLPDSSSIKIAPIFLAPEYKDLISNYEDVSIEKSVKGQIELAGCEVCEPDKADILLYVNNFEEHQGEIVMKVPTKPFSGTWQKPEKPYIVADVRYANGADNAFIEQIFKVGLGENFLGYSAWNTSANSLGSLICGAVITAVAAKVVDAKTQRCKEAKSVSIIVHEDSSNFRHSERQRKNLADTNSTQLQETQNNLTELDQASMPLGLLASNTRPLSDCQINLYKNFSLLLLTRFLDDWAYQANVRQQLASPDEKQVKELMKPFEQRIFEVLKIKPDEYNITYKFPWNRLFEVEVCIS